jgi:hypothetical protein
MKALITALLVATLPALALAQSTPPAKPAPKAAAKSPNPSKLAPSAQKAVEEVTPIDDDPDLSLNPAEKEIAKTVYVGDMPCELGAMVKITPMKREGLFLVTTKGYRFLMHPVESRTGAIRLEDPKRGAMWLQLANKSMLMSQKLGLRLADECMNGAQAAVAEALKRNPPTSILEPLPAAKSIPVSATATSPK